MHHSVRWVVRRRALVVVIAGTGLAATTASATLGGAFAGAVVVLGGIGVVRVVVGVLVVGVVGRRSVRFAAIAAGLGALIGSVLVATPAAPAATPAPTAPVGRTVSLLVIGVVGIEVVVVARIVGVVGVVGVFGGVGVVLADVSLDWLGRDEKRHVLGALDRRLQQQPRLGFVGLNSGARLGCDDRRGDSRGRAGQQVADANRVDAVHGGMSAAGAFSRTCDGLAPSGSS